jgi:Tfp pilus assembly protein PilN
MDMIQINLLPREMRKATGRAALGKTGYYAIGAAAAVILMIAGVTFFQAFQLTDLGQKMEVARFRTEQLQKDIAVVDALIDVKAKIMQRMDAVNRLDRHRTVWVRILEDVSQRVPEFTWLGLLKETEPKKVVAAAPATGANKPATAADNQPTVAEEIPAAGSQPLTRPVEIEGFAFTLNSLANFMINLMQSHFFSDVEMASVEEVQFEKQKAYAYKLTATLHYLSDDELKKILENESGPSLLASF